MSRLWLPRLHRGFRGQGFRSTGFSPTSLSPTLWVRGSYAGSPWVPQTGGNLTEGTNPPAAGTTLNGYAPATFDGTNDRLSLAGTADTYFAVGAAMGLVLAKITSAAAHVSDTANESILSTVGTGRISLNMTDDGAGTQQIRFRTFNGSTSDVVAKTVTFGSWMLIKFKNTGSTVQIGTNGGAWTSAAASPIDNISFAMQMGVSSFDSSGFYDGSVMECMLFDTIKSDADITNYISYLNTRYGLSLT